MNTTSTHHCTASTVHCTASTVTWGAQAAGDLRFVGRTRIVTRRIIPDGCGGYVEIERIEVID